MCSLIFLDFSLMCGKLKKFAIQSYYTIMSILIQTILWRDAGCHYFTYPVLFLPVCFLLRSFSFSLFFQPLMMRHHNALLSRILICRRNLIGPSFITATSTFQLIRINNFKISEQTSLVFEIS